EPDVAAADSSTFGSLRALSISESDASALSEADCRLRDFDRWLLELTFPKLKESEIIDIMYVL
ncbi:MAG: hypothetical protein AAGH89_12490, partial [Verrucomicrobiota bacterium]